VPATAAPPPHTLHLAAPPEGFIRGKLESTSRLKAVARLLALAAQDPTVLLLPTLVEVAPPGEAPPPEQPTS
jgi:hypothetical protein